MSFIRILSPEEADAPLREAFEEVMAWRNGRLPPVMQCMSLHPQAMLGVKRLNEQVTFGASTLGGRREEMIATVVSASNECDY
jgi:alkylhydroperoxidase family enzyme